MSAWAVSAVAICGLLLSAVYSPLFKVKNIILNNVPSGQVEERINEIVKSQLDMRPWYVFPKNSLLFLRIGVLKENLTKTFYASAITVQRRWPNVLTIEFPKSLVIARYRSGEHEWLIDKRGTLIQSYMPDENNDTLVVIVDASAKSYEIGERPIAEAHIARLAALLESLTEGLRNRTEHLYIDQGALPTVKLITKGSWYALFSLGEDPVSQVGNLNRILEEKVKDNEQNLEYVDVRFGNKVYLQMR